MICVALRRRLCVESPVCECGLVSGFRGFCVDKRGESAAGGAVVKGIPRNDRS